ncbi:MAG: FMN-binding protein, partial [Gemmatimonadota bacterium]
APDGWLAQFLDRRLDGRLSTKADIVNMTGATLTSRAVTDAVRRVLALHQVIGPLEDRGR